MPDQFEGAIAAKLVEMYCSTRFTSSVGVIEKPVLRRAKGQLRELEVESGGRLTDSASLIEFGFVIGGRLGREVLDRGCGTRGQIRSREGAGEGDLPET